MSYFGVKGKRDKDKSALPDPIDEKAEDKSKTNRSSFSLSNFFKESEEKKQMKAEWLASVMQTSARLDKLSEDLDKIGKGLDRILAELEKLEDYPEDSLTRFEEMNSDFNDVLTKHDEGKEKYGESMLSINQLSKKMEEFIEKDMENLPPNLQKEVEKLKKQINDAASNLATQMHTEPKLNNTTAKKLKKPENIADGAKKAKLEVEQETEEEETGLSDEKKKAKKLNNADVSGGNDDFEYEDYDESSEIDESEESGSTSKPEADD